MNETEALLFMLIGLGAFFMPFTSKRLMLPSSVGEMVYGMILASVFNLSGEPMLMVNYFASFGFLVLMYLAGLELDLERFRSLSKRDLWLFVLTYLPVMACAIIITTTFDLHWSFALIFGTTGIGLLFPVLKDAGLTKTEFGQNILIIAMIGEILTLIGLTIVTMTYKYGISVSSALHIASIGGFFIVIYMTMRIFKTLLWWYPSLQSLFLKVGNPTETGIRANFVILFSFVAFAAVVQVELVVGAFIGGMMFALVFSGKDAVLERLGGVGYGFFVPMFFISVGLRVSFSDFMQVHVIVMSLVITGVILLTRFAGGMLLFFTSLKKATVPLAALALSFPLTMLVAVAAILFDAGIISKQESSAILLAAVLSAIVYPWLFKLGAAIIMPEAASPDKLTERVNS